MARYLSEERIERIIKGFAGSLVFVTAILGYFHSEYWLFVTMFVGLNLFQYSFTDFCPLKYFLEKVIK
jgi:hypothetical protein